MTTMICSQERQFENRIFIGLDVTSSGVQALYLKGRMLNVTRKDFSAVDREKWSNLKYR